MNTLPLGGYWVSTPWESDLLNSNPGSRTSLVVQWLRIACQRRGHRFDPWVGKIPRAAGQQSPWASTPEPAL